MEPEKSKTKSFHESYTNHSVTKAKLALPSTSMAGGAIVFRFLVSNGI
jgi:hypothetical protein